MNIEGKIHAGRVATSFRLRRVLEALRAAGDHGLTTRDIIAATGMCAINSIAAELRADGYSVSCEYEGMTSMGQRIYRYRLA